MKKNCFIFGNGLSIDLFNWLKAPSGRSPSNILTPARESPERFPALYKLICEIGIEKSDSELLIPISEYLRDNWSRLMTFTDLPALGVTPVGNRKTISSGSLELEIRGCLWEGTRDNDSWLLSENVSNPRMLSWPWLAFMRSIADKAMYSFISYNYDRLPTILIPTVFGNESFTVPANDKGEDLYSFPNVSRIIHVHGNLGFRAGITTGPNVSLRVSECGFDTCFSNDIPEDTPFAPDIIPPGFASASAFWDYNGELWGMAKRAILDSNSVVLAGLSLAGIDLDEFVKLAELYPSAGLKLNQRKFIQFAYDKNELLEECVVQSGNQYVFVDASQQNSFQSLKKWLLT